jgi:hypothetical protein
VANQPAILANVKITADDVNGNNVAKQFNAVGSVTFDFNKGQVNIVDQTGSFYFSAGDLGTVTYTVSAGDFSPVSIVMS